jgi:hypothetical protein
MDDIVIPKSSMLEPGWHYFGEAGSRSGKVVPALPGTDAQPAVQPVAAPPAQQVTPPPAPTRQPVDTAAQSAARASRATLIALKSDGTYFVARYRIDGGAVNYVLANGEQGAVSVKDVDWLKTSQLNGVRRGAEDLDLAQAQ